MTDIVITKATNIYGIQCTGHSGYAESGSDIVCAAISALTESFEMLVETYNDTEDISMKICEIADGYLHVTYYDPKGILQPAFTMITLGLEAIRDQYPYNINISYKF